MAGDPAPDEIALRLREHRLRDWLPAALACAAHLDRPGARLELGSLVAGGVLVLALLLHRDAGPPRRLAWTAALLVGLLAALSLPHPFSFTMDFALTFPLAPSPQALGPSLPLTALVSLLDALLTGVLIMLALTPRQRSAGSAPFRPTLDSALAAALSGLLLLQLALALMQRFHPQWLWLHMLVGLALVTPLGLRVGIQAWLGDGATDASRKLGLLLLGAITGQLVLGLAGWRVNSSPLFDLALLWSHFWLGAGLLALALALSRRSRTSLQAAHGPRLQAL